MFQGLYQGKTCSLKILKIVVIMEVFEARERDKKKLPYLMLGLKDL